jgi:nitrogen regulatory protein PII
MELEGLSRMTRVEVVTTGQDVPLLQQVFKSAGAVGYTAMSSVSGFGHHGLHQGRLAFNERDTQVLLFTVLPEEAAPALVAGVRRWLADRPGVMFVSEVYVSRPEYFRPRQDAAPAPENPVSCWRCRRG